MTFWNGTEWVAETQSTSARGRLGRAAAWVATGIMIGSLALYAVPFASISAGGPTLSLSPTKGAPGTKVTATGKGFTPKTQVQLTWDGASTGMPTVSTNGGGLLRATFQVPKATVGPHVSGAQQLLTTTPSAVPTSGKTLGSNQPLATSSGAVLATAEFDVVAAASPTAVPATPTPPAPTPDPTPAPTGAATPTPDPTAQPTPTPTSAPSAAPTLAPTPTPTPTSAPTVAPPPPPTPTGRPFAAPVTTNVVDVAAGANLQAVVDSAPDGTEFRFPVNGSFTVSAGITLNARHNLIFTGNGSTIRTTGSGGATLASPFVMGYFTISTDIWVRGFDLEGNNPRTGTDIYGGGSEHGVAINGGLRIEISGNTIRHTWGDAIYANANTNGGNNWPTDLWVHDNTFDYIGRNVFTMNSARRARLDHNTADHIAFSLLDIEPDLNTQGVQDVFLRNNTVGVWGLSPNYTTYLVAAANQSNNGTLALIDGVTVTGNVVTVGSPTSPNNPNNGGIRMYFAHPGRASRITVTDNQSPKSGAGLVYAHVDGLTYGRNTQAGTAAPVSVSDCTSVVVVN